PVIFNLDTAELLNRHVQSLGSTINVHIKIDTGMGRVGIPAADSAAFALSVKQFTALNVNGLMTHFAAADVPGESEFTLSQIYRFRAACDEFRAAGHDPEWIDLANSPGAIAYPDSRSNLVRLGGALYGLLDDILPASVAQPPLRPVLSLISGVADLREVAPGQTLSYGRTFTAKRPTTVALVPIGYADGYPRGLSNIGKAWLNGSLVPVVGRISMDWTLLDVTDLAGVERGDEVVLIGGGSDGNAVKASDLARITGTIAYEITCGISPRIPRIFIGGGNR
ncbi:MAG: alanine racemase, partial [Pyrinomonadaceae bacterium]